VECGRKEDTQTGKSWAEELGAYYQRLDSNGKPYERIGEGRWLQFYGGKVSDSYEGSWKPTQRREPVIPYLKRTCDDIQSSLTQIYLESLTRTGFFIQFYNY
jgi:hypothetical protein